MTDKEATLRVIEGLESLGIPYMLVGSLSSSTYGVPRLTQDADLVLHLASASIESLMTFLGPDFLLDPQMSFETVTGTLRHKLQLRSSGFVIELFLLSNDAHDQERFRRKVQKEVMGRRIWLPTAEDVVIMKLRWSKQGRRTKDVEDVKGVLRVQGAALDWAYIHSWCDVHGTLDLLEKTRASLPPMSGL